MDGLAEVSIAVTVMDGQAGPSTVPWVRARASNQCVLQIAANQLII